MSHADGPPPEEVILRRDRAREQPEGRDVTPAVGKRGGPAEWRHPGEVREIAGQSRRWQDARWSFLYDKATRYARATAGANGRVREAAQRMRAAPEPPSDVQGPFIHAPVWTWEVPVYFWFGGIAAGSSFVALACDAAGDQRSARLARMLTVAAVGPCAPLLILDLGRPARFLHMLRIVKVRSPMSMGAWCLSAFSGAAAGGVLADLLGRRGLARAAGAATALLGTYLGSYTGVLLASTAVPVWNRSRSLLPPIFICTAAAGGAAANRLLLAATGAASDHPTRQALEMVETAAMTAELALSAVNERRLGELLGRALTRGRPGRRLSWARRLTLVGLGLRAVRRPAAGHASSGLFLAAALLFRFAWVQAGIASSDDDEAVATAARQRRA
jgi:formate-dependent nitrite reductase membrane component NrfD